MVSQMGVWRVALIRWCVAAVGSPAAVAAVFKRAQRLEFTVGRMGQFGPPPRPVLYTMIISFYIGPGGQMTPTFDPLIR